MENKAESFGIPLAGFLFGNIDESGQLDTDLFDNDTKKYLGSLTRLGLDSLLDEIIGSENISTVSSYRKDSSNSGSDSDEETEVNFKKNEEQDDEDTQYAKDPSAIDYGDINELAEDNFPEIKQESIKVDGKVTEDTTDYDADDEEAEKVAASLMPPPPEPKEDKEEKMEAKIRRKLDTPLAAMLPSKYADVDVTEIFPDFRYDKVN